MATGGAHESRFRALTLGARIDRDELGELRRALASDATAGGGRRLLVRRLDGAGIDAAVFRAAPATPTPAPPRDAGQRLAVTWSVEADGVPCLCHDEAAGVSLHRMLVDARRRREPLGERTALVIARDLGRALDELERLGGGDRAGHGFLLPHLVWITEDGAALLTAAEAAPALRACLASGAFGELAPYTAHLDPARPASAADDVYSLGLLLLAMITGREPPIGPGETEAAIAAGIPSFSDGSLRAGLAQLLSHSLADEPASRPSLGRWRGEIERILAGSEPQPTALDVALHLLNHHRDELAAFGADAETPAGNGEEEEEEEALAARGDPTGTPAHPPATAPRRSGRRLAALAAAAAIAMLLVSGYLLSSSRPAAAPPDAGTETPTAPEPVPDPTAPSAEQPPEPPVDAPDPSQPRAAGAAEVEGTDLERLVDRTLGERAASLRQDYEAQVDALERRLEELEPAAEAAPPVATRAPSEPEVRPATAGTAGPTPAELPSRSGAPPDPAPGGGEPPSLPVPRTVRPAGSEAGTATDGTVDRAGAPDLGRPPATAETAPELIQEPRLVYPRRARRLNREADITVRVRIDTRGRVVAAELAPEQETGYGFGQAALEAARTALYRPATRGGEPVEAWTTIRLVYALE